MRGVVFVGTSLDGFIARRDGGLDFLSATGDESHGFEELLASVDALLMGRNTYDFVVGFDSWPYADKPVFVLSSRNLGPLPPGSNVERVHGSPSEVAANLDARGMENVYVDGGVTIQQFLRAGLIRRLIITRVPVLIGSGRSLFSEVEHDMPLKHVATRHFPSGLVQSEYEVVAQHLPRRT